MSKQVDVLSKLDRRIEIGELFGQEPDAPNLPGEASLREVRAAVAELIEAADAFFDGANTWPEAAKLEQLRRARVRCNGGAA